MPAQWLQLGCMTMAFATCLSNLQVVWLKSQDLQAGAPQLLVYRPSHGLILWRLHWAATSCLRHICQAAFQPMWVFLLSCTERQLLMHLCLLLQ